MSEKLIALFLVLVTILAFTTACTTSEDEYADDYATEEAAADEDTSTITDGSCASQLDAMLSDDEDTADSSDLPADLDEEYILVTYQVDGDEISSPKYENSIPDELVVYQEDTATQEYIWQYFIQTVPADQREMVSEFVVFSDGYSNVIGAVDEGDIANTWSFEMDIIDARDLSTLSTTVIHEFGHMLTLNDKQINDKTSCANYMSIDGCSESDSYINAFYNAFWTDIYSEWESTVLDSSGEVNEDAVIEFYDQYPDQFVSDYAPTGIEEDIAESFMYFIFSPEPAGDTIAEQKILFFYDYPELVEMRNGMVNIPCTYVGQ